MKLFKKFLGKLFSFILLSALLINVVLTPVFVKAQEASSSATPAPVATPEPSVTPTPTPEASPTNTPESTPSATPSATPTPSATQAPTPTPAPVAVGTTYSSPNGQAKVKFNSISADTGSLTISETTLSSNQAAQIGALSSTVYEISSSMSNGSFKYDLTLPLPEGVDGANFKVKYANSVNELNNAQEVGEQITINNDRTFTIHNLDHFTVFVVVNPNTQANCDAVALGTTSGTTCFATIQAASDASSNNDSITIGAGTYNETVNVTKQLTFTGQGNPVVTAFVLQTTPSTFTGITAGSTTIANPTVSLTNPVFSGNQSNVIITGTGAANAVVNYTISGTSGSVSGTGTVSSAGTINIGGIDVSSLPDGNLTLSVTLSSGGYSSSAATASAAKDTQAPSLAANLSVTNPIHNSNKATIALSGNGEANSTANWTISNGAFSVSGTATVSPEGNFGANTIDVSSLPDGTLTLSVTLTDTAGNTNSAATTTTNKDTTAPTLTSVAISSSNANTNYAKVGDTVNLVFTSPETIQAPVVTIAGHLASPTNTGGNNWLASYTLISSDTEGLVSFVINFTDSVGNAANPVTSTTNSSGVTFDKTNPALSSVTAASSNSNPSLAKVGDTITLTFTSSETIQTPVVTIAGQTATVTNSGNNWTATYNMTAGDTEGLIAYTINHSDLAGNNGTSVSANSTITLDKTAPTLSAINVSSNNPNSAFAKVGNVITLTFTSSETIQTPSVTLAGQTATVSGSGTSWTATYIMQSSDTESLIAYSINFQDQAGNSGTNNANSAITFDKTNPTLTSTVTSSNANGSFAKVGDIITVAVTASENIQTPVVTIAGHSVTVSGSGNSWSATYTMVAGDTEGLIPYTITFTDLAGNNGTSINTNSTVTFDKTNPALSSVTAASSNSNPSLAKVGDTITLTFTSSETIQTPVVTIAGQTVTVTNSGNNWTATLSMAAGDTEGLIAYTISYQDLASNLGTAVNTNSTITFDKTAPSLTSTVITSSNSNASFAKVGDTLTVTITASETIQTPTVTVAGHAVTAANTSGNTWTASYTMVTGDTEGLVSYTISFSDSAGNAGTPVNTNSAVTFDQTVPSAPSVSLTNPVNSSNKTNVAISGTGEANASFVWSINTISGTGTVSGSGVISVTGINVSSLSDGTITLSVTQTDQAGNTGSAGTNTATKDTVAPTLTSTAITSDNPNSAFAKIGNTITLTFIASETVQTPVVTIAGQNVIPTNTSSNNWSAAYTMQTSDQEGLIAYTIAFTDIVGNAATTVNANSAITFDKTNPNLSSTSVTTSNSNSSYAKAGDVITVTFTSSETIQTPSVTIAGNAATVSGSGTSWTATYIMQSSDTESLIAYSINFQDQASNAGTNSADSSITFDKTAPNAPVVAMSNPVNNSNKMLVTIVGTGEANTAISFSIQDSASNTVSGVGLVDSSGNILISNIDVTGLLDGSLGLFVYLTDPAGNLSTAGLNTSNKDTVNPSITVSSVTTTNSNSNFAKAGDIITLNFSASETVNTPIITIAGHAVSVTNLGGNNWSAAYTMVTGDSEGLIAYTINATDLSGNSATPVVANSTITFDESAPAAPSVSLTNPVNDSNKTSVAISGTGEANANFTWSITDGTNTVSGTGTVSGSGNISVTGINASTLNDGTITVSVTLTDGAGNTGSSGTNTAFKDTVAPNLTSAITTSNTNAAYAKTDDIITISLTSSETIQAPVITIAGHSVTATNTTGNIWVAAYTMASSDTEGLIAYTIGFTDTSGNAGTTVNINSSITFDKTAPTLSAINVSSNNSSSNFAKAGNTITITFASSETIQAPTVTIAGHSVTATNTSGNDWTAEYIMQVTDPEGLISYTINFQDSASNTGSVNANSTITFDKTVPISSADNVISGWFTSNPTITLTVSDTGGASLDASKVRYMWDGIATTTSGTVFINGQTINIPGEGSHTLTLYAEDSAGNVHNSFSQVYKLDTVTPNDPGNLSTTTPTNSTTQVWSWTAATDATSGIQVYLVSIDEAVFTSIGNVTSYTTNLSAGLHTLRLVVYDNAGNTGSIVSYSVLVDNIAPTGTWTTPVAGSNVSGNVALTAAASDVFSGVSSVSFQYKRNNGVDTFHNIAGTTWDTNALALDNYTLRLIVTDNAGNTTIVDQTVGVATVIPSSSVSSGSVSTDGVVITWTTDDPTTSRVIYDTVSRSSLGAAPNYGYSKSTTTFDTNPKVTNHSVTLTGLNPSTKYFYRVISAGSPESVSEEFSITTAAAPQAQGGAAGEISASMPGAPVCSDLKPQSAPVLLSVKVFGKNKIKLVWSKAKDPVTYYLIEYGTAHDQYQFGVPDAGNVTEYEIGELQAGVTYYFRVRAGNHCAPGEFSNELSAKADGSATAGQIAEKVAGKIVETVSFALGASTVSASEVAFFSPVLETNNMSLASDSAKEATTGSESINSVITSPTLKTESNKLFRNILLLAGIILLTAGGYTYYLKKLRSNPRG